MYGDRQPDGFAPGALLDRLQSRILREAGFEPGYPLFSVPNGGAIDDLQLIMHALTFPRQGEYGGDVRQVRPIMRMGALVPDGSGYGKIWFTPTRIDEIRRSWRGYGAPYWYLSGSLVDRDPDQRWHIDRRAVVSCQIRALLKEYEAYVQFVPMGSSNQLPPPSGDEFRWGNLDSRTLPPNPAK